MNRRKRETTVATRVPRPASRGVILALLIGLLAVWTWATWPRLIQPFSASAPVVDALDTDVLYDADGLTDEQVAGIRGAIGDRPITFAFIPADYPEADRDLCRGVIRVLPDVQFIIVREGEFDYACTGDDVRTTGQDDLHGFAYELELNYALDLLDDPVAQAQAAALTHDNLVQNGKLADEQREFRTPWGDVARTLGVAVGVLAAILLMLFGLRTVSLRSAVRKDRDRRQEQIRDELDDALAELALVVVDRSPDDPRRPGPPVAAEYVTLLEQARTASGGWQELLQRARELLGDGERAATR